MYFVGCIFKSFMLFDSTIANLLSVSTGMIIKFFSRF